MAFIVAMYASSYNSKNAFEYYTKCIAITADSPYKALAYSNLGACYFDNENYSDAEKCFQKAYEREKSNNNYDGIYYVSMYLAKIFLKEGWSIPKPYWSPRWKRRA